MAAKCLTSEQLEMYKLVLLEERMQAQKIIRCIDDNQKLGAKNSSGDLSSYSLHQADLGSDTIEAEKNVYLLEKEIERLRNINKALKRVYEQTYGICEICGELIPDKRLKIVPSANYCIVCKSKEERKNRRR